MRSRSRGIVRDLNLESAQLVVVRDSKNSVDAELAEAFNALRRHLRDGVDVRPRNRFRNIVRVALMTWSAQLVVVRDSR